MAGSGGLHALASLSKPKIPLTSGGLNAVTTTNPGLSSMRSNTALTGLGEGPNSGSNRESSLISKKLDGGISSGNVISEALTAMSLRESISYSKSALLVPKLLQSNLSLSTMTGLNQKPVSITAKLSPKTANEKILKQKLVTDRKSALSENLLPDTNYSTSIFAKPSAFASFWTSDFTFLDASTHVKINNQVFANLLDASTVDGKKFDFSTPSPDDRVFAARSGKLAGTKPSIGNAYNAKTSTKPVNPNVQAIITQGIKSISISSSLASSSKNSTKSHVIPKSTIREEIPRSRSVSPVRASSPARSTTSVASSGKVGIPVQQPPQHSKVGAGKKIDVLAEYAKRNSDKSSINLVIVGHVDAGKSTLMGHLLYLLGEVNEKTMKKYERDAEKMKKGSFCFAWVLDETEEERSRGVTIDVGMSYFETESHRFTILDAPGHRDFIPNMISGASQADAALLVIDSGTGEFEVGFELGGQTREHALLVRSLGVNQLVVAINKLDMMSWSQARFLEIKEKLFVFFLGAGFKKNNIFFVPCSGFTGENMIERKSDILKSWYSGLTLQESLDGLTPPIRELEKPFRLPVVDYFKGGVTAGGGGSLSVSGRVEAGTLQIGDIITVMPLGEHGVVKSIEANNNPIKWAVAGDNIVIAISGIETQQINIGNVLCSPHYLVPVADVFTVKIVTFDIVIPLTLGVPIVVHHQSASTPGIISKLFSLLDKSTGEVIKKNPRALAKNVTAVIEIKVERPICIELAKDSRELGRLMIRSGSSVVAAGIVTVIVNRVK
ncbi:HBS1-like protein [Physocladia obscura]|uniref:Elongation factor 1 alpha-like protein n=1 Tax=Physocladia obscura TaxID=109957 RepID=A0AAD5T8A2_9FUNG|nr:HBS1-like protein [Physocladia obscura]